MPLAGGGTRCSARNTPFINIFGDEWPALEAVTLLFQAWN